MKSISFMECQYLGNSINKGREKWVIHSHTHIQNNKKNKCTDLYQQILQHFYDNIQTSAKSNKEKKKKKMCIDRCTSQEFKTLWSGTQKRLKKHLTIMQASKADMFNKLSGLNRTVLISWPMDSVIPLLTNDVSLLHETDAVPSRTWTASVSMQWVRKSLSRLTQRAGTEAQSLSCEHKVWTHSYWIPLNEGTDKTKTVSESLATWGSTKLGQGIRPTIKTKGLLWYQFWEREIETH